MAPLQNSSSTPVQMAAVQSTQRRRLNIGPAFWTTASIISLAINVILIVALLGLGTQVFALKNVIEQQVLGGLYKNFILMDQAHIRTNIPVTTDVPAKFTLPLKTNTTVVLVEDTTLTNATVARLETGGLSIYNAPATIVLPKGTKLPIALDLTVPVDQKIPVSLNVAVDIPLKETELHEPFVGLQEVVRPYYQLMSSLPNNWAELLCGPNPGSICNWLFR